MNNLRADYCMIAYVWLLTIAFAVFYGFEFSSMKYEAEMRKVYQGRIDDNNKLINCQNIIARIK